MEPEKLANTMLLLLLLLLLQLLEMEPDPTHELPLDKDGQSGGQRQTQEAGRRFRKLLMLLMR